MRLMSRSAARVLGMAGCTGDRDTLTMQDSQAVTAPATRPMDDAVPIDQWDEWYVLGPDGDSLEKQTWPSTPIPARHAQLTVLAHSGAWE